MDEPTYRAVFVASFGGEQLTRILLVHLQGPGFAHLLRLLDILGHAAYLLDSGGGPRVVEK
jgi:hypothetical protein